MPAERAGSSPGGQGKAIPVEETAVQLSLPIATAENPQGATRRQTRDRLGAIRAGAPKAIGNAGKAAPATMEEVAKRLTDALLKVASNKGARGPDGQTIEALLEQWPVVLPRLQADLLSGVYRPGVIRRAYIPLWSRRHQKSEHMQVRTGAGARRAPRAGARSGRRTSCWARPGSSAESWWPSRARPWGEPAPCRRPSRSAGTEAGRVAAHQSTPCGP